MRVAELTEFGSPETGVHLAERPDPGDPGPGEVGIAAEFSPINPSDLLNIQGLYGAEPPELPTLLGVEGVGRVVRCGAGVTHLKEGDRVLLPGPGTWRERFRIPAQGRLPLPDGVDPRQLAMLGVNPATAHVMLHDFVPPRAGNWVLQNAANSGVGTCVIRLAREAGLKSVNVVRRPDLVEPLRALGGDVVLVDGPHLEDRVREATGGGSLPLALDAVGGTATGRLAKCVDDGGIVVNYGAMSGEACHVDPRETIFHEVTLRGFWLRRWFDVTPPRTIGETYVALATKMAQGKLAVEVEKVYPFRELLPALQHAARSGRSGKVLLSFA